VTVIQQDPPRTSYLGGGDVAAICGKSEWRTPMDVWLEKTGKAQPLVQTERMQWGLLLEPVILRAYAARHDAIVEPGSFVAAPSEPWRGGHPDGVAVFPDGSLRLLEAKATSKHLLAEWQKEIPVDYRYQGQHYLALLKLPLCTFPVLFGGQRLDPFDMEADPIVQHEIQSVCKDFWHDYVLANKPPPGSSVEHAGHLFGTREATSSEQVALAEIARLRAAATDIEDQLESRKAALEDWARDVTLTVGGEVLAEWKDVERKAYTVPAKSYRHLSLARYPKLAKVLGIQLDRNPDQE
jgi:predicted phage-related endonuclease